MENEPTTTTREEGEASLNRIVHYYVSMTPKVPFRKLYVYNVAARRGYELSRNPRRTPTK